MTHTAEDVYDKIDNTRKELVSKVAKWRMRRDLEMDELRRENERLKEALAAEAAHVMQLKMELKLSTARIETVTSSAGEPAPASPSGRRRLVTENGRPAVSLWNNTEEEKEKVYAVLKEGRT